MREGLKPERYNLRMAPPLPLVPRRLRLGVRQAVLEVAGRPELTAPPRFLFSAFALSIGGYLIKLPLRRFQVRG